MPLGREKLLEEIDEHAATPGAKTLVLTGESVNSKLAILAESVARWQTQHPDDLVRRSLSLIACSRFGLSETELLDLQGKKNEEGEHVPLPRRNWMPFYFAAENALAQRSGLLTFGHDYLRQAVERRFFKSENGWKSVRLDLAEWFEAIPETTERKLDELPCLLRDTELHERLVKFLSDIETFLQMRKHQRWKRELHAYWLLLEGRYNPVGIYQNALDAIERDFLDNRFVYVFNEVATFHYYSGRFGGAAQLYRRVLKVQEQLLGKKHPDTLMVKKNLDALLKTIKKPWWKKLF
ncbi:MAG: tetratricopeptide repeat protein [Chlorobium sp.]